MSSSVLEISNSCSACQRTIEIQLKSTGNDKVIVTAPAGMISLPCGHCYHLTCGLEFLTFGTKCPKCTLPGDSKSLSDINTLQRSQLMMSISLCGGGGAVNNRLPADELVDLIEGTTFDIHKVRMKDDIGVKTEKFIKFTRACEHKKNMHTKLYGVKSEHYSVLNMVEPIDYYIRECGATLKSMVECIDGMDFKYLLNHGLDAEMLLSSSATREESVVSFLSLPRLQLKLEELTQVGGFSESLICVLLMDLKLKLPELKHLGLTFLDLQRAGLTPDMMTSTKGMRNLFTLSACQELGMTLTDVWSWMQMDKAKCETQFRWVYSDLLNAYPKNSLIKKM
jgi:hypothetical protein